MAKNKDLIQEAHDLHEKLDSALNKILQYCLKYMDFSDCPDPDYKSELGIEYRPDDGICFSTSNHEVVPVDYVYALHN